MEYEGFQRCMNFLSAMPCGIATFVSDRHSSVIKHMREKLSGIKHYFDLWHLKKVCLFYFHIIASYQLPLYSPGLYSTFEKNFGTLYFQIVRI